MRAARWRQYNISDSVPLPSVLMAFAELAELLKYANEQRACDRTNIKSVCLQNEIRNIFRNLLFTANN
jgi:hypothetical protein